MATGLPQWNQMSLLPMESRSKFSPNHPNLCPIFMLIVWLFFSVYHWAAFLYHTPLLDYRNEQLTNFLEWIKKAGDLFTPNTTSRIPKRHKTMFETLFCHDGHTDGLYFHREYYDVVFPKMVKSLGKPMMLTGTPGMGKSRFGFFMLHCLLTGTRFGGKQTVCHHCRFTCISLLHLAKDHSLLCRRSYLCCNKGN